VARIPDIVIELPPEWRWAQRDKAPLGLAPESASGALQISSPASSVGWRGGDLDVLVREFVAGSKLGEVLRVEQSDAPYGRMVHAEMVSAAWGDIAAWLLVHDTHDPLVVTWIADTPTDDGRIARDLVRTIAPGPFSRTVDMIVSLVRDAMATKGSVEYHTVLVADGTIQTAYFHGMPDEMEREAIRAETQRVRASAAARVGMLQMQHEGEVLLAAFVHAESASIKKRFLIPQAERGRVAHEVNPASAAIADFFLAPDPRVVEALARSRQPPGR